MLDRENIDYSDNSERDEDLELALQRIPARVPPGIGEGEHSRMEWQPFRFPLPGSPRAGVMEPGFQLDGNLREFTRDNLAGLKMFAAEAVILPLDLALILADQKQRALFDLPSLKTAIVVLTSLARPPLREEHREFLWRAFGVPVFEQLRGWNGAVICWECEVHDGLHLDDSAILQLQHGELLLTQLNASEPVVRARTGLTGKIVRGLCECGATTPRVRNLAALQRSVAAAA